MQKPDTERPDRAEIASKGGAARAESLTPSRRSEIAKGGALARWSQNFPHAVCEGTIDFAGRSISCAVLDTKLRVLTQETFLTTLGRASKAKGGKGSERMMRVGGLPPFLAAENLQPFISDELRQAATPVVFRTKRGNKAYGYDARLLPLVCEVYLLARDAHLNAHKEAQASRSRGEQVEAKAVCTSKPRAHCSHLRFARSKHGERAHRCTGRPGNWLSGSGSSRRNHKDPRAIYRAPSDAMDNSIPR